MKYAGCMMVLFAGVLSVSCRSLVYERRTDCPRYVFIDVVNDGLFNPGDKVSVGVAKGRGGEVTDTDTTTLEALRGRKYFVSASEGGTVSVCGAVGFGGGTLSGGSRWTACEGEEYPRLFRFEGSVIDPEDGEVVGVELVKEYCDVTLRFSGYDAADVRGGLCPFTVDVEGNSCGVDAMTGVPVYGWYPLTPAEREEGVFRFRVPRQLDESLTLRVGLKEGVTGYPQMEREVSLCGRFRLLGNVTWEEKNLPDVSMEIDVSGPSYRISVAAWNDGDGVDREFGKGLGFDVDL